MDFEFLSSILADVNECSQELCSDKENSACENTEGSFRCKCEEGFRMSADRTTCEGKKTNFNITFFIKSNMKPRHVK